MAEVVGATEMILAMAATGAAWWLTFRSRGARTWRMLAVMAALSGMYILPPVLNALHRLPSAGVALVIATASCTWLIATNWGERLGLFALSAEEDRFNARLRAIAAWAGIFGAPAEPAEAASDSPRLLRELEALSPPDAAWGRVVQLIRECVISTPNATPVDRQEMWQFDACRRAWSNVHDRRIIRGSRSSAAFDFEVDLRLGITATLRDIAGSDLDSASGEIETIEASVAPTPEWVAAKVAALNWLRALALARVGTSAEAPADAAGLLAVARSTWPQGHDPSSPLPLSIQS